MTGYRHRLHGLRSRRIDWRIPAPHRLQRVTQRRLALLVRDNRVSAFRSTPRLRERADVA